MNATHGTLGFLLVIATALLAGIWFAACGDDRGDDLPPHLMARYSAVEACTGLRARPPRIDFAETAPCKSGSQCCLRDYLPVQAGAVYYPEDRLIVGHADDPRCGDPIRFEMTRHVLCVNGNIDRACVTEGNLTDPRWGCSA